MSSNASPLIVELSASISMREYPVNTTPPGSPDADVRVSGFVTSRTVSSYVPSAMVIVSPAAALSMRFCRSDRGSASITYACGDHCGSPYTVPPTGSRPMPTGWLVREATPIWP